MGENITMNLSKILKEYLDERGETLRLFADKAGISYSYVHKLLKGVDPRSQKPFELTLRTFKQLADAMGKPVDELLLDCGYFEQETRDIWALKELLDKLPPETRELLENDSSGKYIEFAEKLRKEEIDIEYLDGILQAARKLYR